MRMIQKSVNEREMYFKMKLGRKMILYINFRGRYLLLEFLFEVYFKKIFIPVFGLTCFLDESVNLKRNMYYKKVDHLKRSRRSTLKKGINFQKKETK